MSFDLESYNYQLPQNKIAAFPLAQKAKTKMLVFDRASQKIEHRRIADILEYIDQQTLFVANNTKVFPARLTGKKKTGAYLELLLVEKIKKNIWNCKLYNSRKVKMGEFFELAEATISARLLTKNQDGTCRIEFFCEQNFDDLLQQVGKAPLPPYILKQRKHNKQKNNDQLTYQTIYAQKSGSIAAPTAGLHFTPKLLEEIKKKCTTAFVTLHIGLGTFEPVVSDDIRRHKMHKEYYQVGIQTLKKLQESKNKQTKILAVGTTSVRVLESLENKIATQTPTKAIFENTDIFIYPPYSFCQVNHLLTNFHLPKSSLMMLVAAFCGQEQLKKLYQIAIAKNYRFYSYGDCMLIL